MSQKRVAIDLSDVRFLCSATKPADYPELDGAEVAFAGRSNVGKSSLMNALLARRKLVKVSKTPGRTQLINFFAVDDRLTFVDLPGYGFARVPLKVKETWGRMIELYLERRHTLAAVAVLIDLRRGIEPDDRELIEALPHYGRQPIVVFTKSDKLKPNARRAQVRRCAESIGARAEEMIVTSATKRDGLDALWARILNLVGRS